jgi:hypothetical protein
VCEVEKRHFATCSSSVGELIVRVRIILLSPLLLMQKDILVFISGERCPFCDKLAVKASGRAFCRKMGIAVPNWRLVWRGQVSPGGATELRNFRS